MKALIIILTLFFSFFFISCFSDTKVNQDAEINRLNSILSGINDTLTICQQSINYEIAIIDSVNSLIQNTKSKITSDSIDIKNYFSEHKMAIACILAGNLSSKIKLDFEHDYPDIIEEASSWGIVLSFGYYLFNTEEVDNVYNTAIEADKKKNEYYSAIATYNQIILDANKELSNIRNIQVTYQNKQSNINQKINLL